MTFPIPMHFVVILLVALIAVIVAVRARKAGHLPPIVAWGVIALGVAATILLFVWPILPFVDRRLDDGVPLQDATGPAAPVNPAGPAARATTEGGNPAGTPEMASYLTAANAADLFEVQSGNLARRRGQSSAVRELGERFAIEHRQSTATLNQIAKMAGLQAPPAAIAPGQSALLRRMDEVNDADFDQIWFAAQIEAHKAALGVHTDAAHRLPPGQMASFAKAQAQKVTTHLEHLASIRRTDGTR